MNSHIIPPEDSCPDGHGRESDFDSLFDVLPIELQVELLSYLHHPEYRKMRLVSRRWDSEISSLTSIPFNACKFNDDTFQAVLHSSKYVECLIVEGLVENSISSIAFKEEDFNIIRAAPKIIFGQRIRPENVLEILQNAEMMTTLGVFNFDICVANILLDFPQRLENITRLQLKLNIAVQVTEDETKFICDLFSLDQKFPHICHFDVDWATSKSPREVINCEEAHRLHAIYISVHEFLVAHRQTIQSISWDFKGLKVLPYLDDSEWPSRNGHYLLLEMLEQVALKEVILRLCDMEGDHFWDLSETLILSQHSLTRLEYEGHGYLRGFPLLPDLLINNAEHLRELIVDPWALNLIPCCRQLTKLHLTPSLTTQAAIADGIHICSSGSSSLGSLIEVSVNYNQDYKGPNPLASQVIGWISKLPNASSIEIQVEIQNPPAPITFLPSEEDFITLMKKSRSLKLFRLIYLNIDSASKLNAVIKKLDIFKMLCSKLPSSKVKVRVTDRYWEKTKEYEMKFKLQRRLSVDN